MLLAANQDLGSRVERTLQAAGVETELVTGAAATISRLKTTEGLALIDYEMAGFGGARAIQLARALLGERPLGVIYGLAAPAMAHRVLSAGATGVLTDDLDVDAMRAALTFLQAGQRFAIYGRDTQFVPFDAAAKLTDREVQVLHGVCDGLQNKEIAHRFGISEVTVKMHVRAIIRKFGARNRTHAAMIARDMKII